MSCEKVVLFMELQQGKISQVCGRVKDNPKPHFVTHFSWPVRTRSTLLRDGLSLEFVKSIQGSAILKSVLRTNINQVHAKRYI